MREGIVFDVAASPCSSAVLRVGGGRGLTRRLDIVQKTIGTWYSSMIFNDFFNIMNIHLVRKVGVRIILFWKVDDCIDQKILNPLPPPPARSGDICNILPFNTWPLYCVIYIYIILSTPCWGAGAAESGNSQRPRSRDQIVACIKNNNFFLVVCGCMFCGG